jgi:secretion/DNA translocation related CpaE-like protein
MASALLLTRDVTLRDEVVRIASAAGADVATPVGVEGADGDWRRAAVVVVGADLVDEVARQRWGRRAGVLVVSWGVPGDAVFRPALALGAEAVVEMPAAAAQLAETFADAGEGRLSRGLVIGVVGGSGGAGATTFAAALAQSAAPGRRAILVDADVLGPGLDAIFATVDVPGLRWSELHGSAGRLGGRTVREALPRIRDLPFLTWGGVGRMPSVELLREVVASARRANDLVVIDICRSLDPLAAEALAACDLVLMVVEPSTAGLSSANRLIAQLPDRSRVRAVVRGSLRSDDAIGIGVVTRMRDERRLEEALSLGLGPLRNGRGPLGRAVRSILTWLQGGAG